MGKRNNFGFELSFFESLHKRMPNDLRVVSNLAHLYTETSQLDLGLKMDRKLVRMTPEDPTVHYNLACSLALKQRKTEAVAVLRQAIDLGYDDFGWMRHDPDLKNLQDYQGFLQLLEDFKIG
jgi:Flp pilus assembly protein TadD